MTTATTRTTTSTRTTMWTTRATTRFKFSDTGVLMMIHTVVRVSLAIGFTVAVLHAG